MFRALFEYIINSKFPSGFNFSFYNLKVKHLNRIELTEVKIFHNNQRIATVKGLEITILYMLLFRGAKKFYKFRLKGAIIEAHSTKGTSTDQSKTAKKITGFFIHRIISKFLRLIFLSVPETEIEDFSIKYKKYTLIVNRRARDWNLQSLSINYLLGKCVKYVS